MTGSAEPGRRATADPGSARVGGGGDRRIPAWIAALLLAFAGAVLLLAALLAGRAGPLVAHPPTIPVPEPPTLSPHPLTMPALPTAAQREPSGQSGSWPWWVAAVIGAVALALLLAWLVRVLRRPRGFVVPPLGPRAATRSASAFGWLDQDPDASDATDPRTFDPRRAADEIIACWGATEVAAAQAGFGRAPASTPTEFLQALTGRFGVPTPGEAGIAGSDIDAVVGVPGGDVEPDRAAQPVAAVLLRLYHRARFDTAALAPGMAILARRAARALIAGIGVDPDAPVGAVPGVAATRGAVDGAVTPDAARGDAVTAPDPAAIEPDRADRPGRHR